MPHRDGPRDSHDHSRTLHARHSAVLRALGGGCAVIVSGGGVTAVSSAADRDLLGGLLGRAATRAAEALSGTLGCPFDTAIPELRWLTLDGCRDEWADTTDGPAVGISETFAGAISGAATLLFSEASGVALAHAILPDGEAHDSASEAVEEVLTEVGNVWLNACIAAMAESMGGDFAGDLPVFSRGDPLELLRGDRRRRRGDDVVLLAGTRVCLRGRAFSGRMALLIDDHGLADLLRVLPTQRLSAA
jgi:chemotaxis protein CheC